MIKPSNRRTDSCHRGHSQFRRSPQQHHGNAQLARRSDLAVGRAAAAVLHDDYLNRMREEQRSLLFFFKRASREDVARIWYRERRFHGIDTSNQIMVLRRRGKVRDLLSTHGEEHILGLDAQRVNGLACIEHFGPSITGDRLPWRPAQRNHRGTRLQSGAECVGRNRRRIRMSRINQRLDLVVEQILREAGDPAEPTAAHGNRLNQGRGGAARQRQGYRDVGTVRKVLPELSGLGRPPKNEDVFSHVAR
jgi:hypothetical protein